MTEENHQAADGSTPDTPLTGKEFAEYLAIRTQERLAELPLAERAKRLAATRQFVDDAKAGQAL